MGVLKTGFEAAVGDLVLRSSNLDVIIPATKISCDAVTDSYSWNELAAGKVSVSKPIDFKGNMSFKRTDLKNLATLLGATITSNSGVTHFEHDVTISAGGTSIKLTAHITGVAISNFYAIYSITEILSSGKGNTYRHNSNYTASTTAIAFGEYKWKVNTSAATITFGTNGGTVAGKTFKVIGAYINTASTSVKIEFAPDTLPVEFMLIADGAFVTDPSNPKQYYKTLVLKKCKMKGDVSIFNYDAEGEPKDISIELEVSVETTGDVTLYGVA